MREYGSGLESVGSACLSHSKLCCVTWGKSQNLSEPPPPERYRDDGSSHTSWVTEPGTRLRLVSKEREASPCLEAFPAHKRLWPKSRMTSRMLTQCSTAPEQREPQPSPNIPAATVRTGH